MTEKFKPEKKSKTMNAEQKARYAEISMAYASKTRAGDEEGALLLKKELILMEKGLSMTPEQVTEQMMKSNPGSNHN